MLPSWITDPLWDQFHALLPERIDQHPLGCHRPRIVFDKLLQALVFGCGYQRVADHTCSERTLRRRRDEWIAAGVADQLHRLAVAAYDRLIGLELDHLVVDGCITRRRAAARSPAQARSTAARAVASGPWWWRAKASRLALSPRRPTAATTACWPSRSIPWDALVRCPSTGCWGEVVELVDLLGGQLDAVGGDVLLDPGDAPGAGDGGDVVALGQQPGQGDLGRGGANLGRDCLDLVGDGEGALDVLAGRRPVRGVQPQRTVVARSLAPRFESALDKT